MERIAAELHIQLSDVPDHVLLCSTGDLRQQGLTRHEKTGQISELPRELND